MKLLQIQVHGGVILNALQNVDTIVHNEGTGTSIWTFRCLLTKKTTCFYDNFNIRKLMIQIMKIIAITTLIPV